MEISFNEKEVKGIVEIFLREKGYLTDINKIHIDILPESTGYGMGEKTEYKFSCITAECSVIVEESE